MQVLMTMLAVVAGMTFSMAVAVLVEELIFGKLFGAVLASSGRFSRHANGMEAVSNK